MKKRDSFFGAFTIVELLVVIVVIGILATVAIVSYSGISNKAYAATVKSDLKNASTQLEMYSVDNGAYPANADALRHSPDTTYQYTYTSTDNSYCLTATNHSISYYISSDSKVPTLGYCSGHQTIDYRVAVLVVAGGGGGGNDGGAGGGAGGVVYIPSKTLEPVAYNITIGGGGDAGAVGQNSVFGDVIAKGGGAGGNGNGIAGGSGGGGSGLDPHTGGVATQTNPVGGIGYGYAGGNHTGSGYAGAGGGGGGGVGLNSVNGTAADGGIGYWSTISGIGAFYAGGGGGGAETNHAHGGLGGGGDGSQGWPVAGNPGTPNTGGGGGGGGDSGNGAAGGSGVVIVAYPLNTLSATGGDEITEVAGYKIHTFKISGTFTVN